MQKINTNWSDHLLDLVKHRLPESLPQITIGVKLDGFSQLAAVDDAVGDGGSVVAVSGDVHRMGSRHSNEQACYFTSSAG